MQVILHPIARPLALFIGAISILAMCASNAWAGDPAEARWDHRTAMSLLDYIGKMDGHGLRPSDYGQAELQNALRAGDRDRIEAQATRSFALVAEDLAVGHVKPGRRGRYYIAPNTLDPELVERQIEEALDAHDVSAVLDALAPRTTEYIALRQALAGADGKDPAKRSKLLASLERSRWFPRNPGQDYLIVNIPAYRLWLMRGGREVATHKVIVGKPNLATPQFEARVTGVILNPPWVVPQSIIRESVGALVRTNPSLARSRGYTWTTVGGRLSVTQQPGAENSLGQMKLDMPNPLSIFVHDTPSKSLFDREDRAFSHGCVRVQNPFDLAATLLATTGRNRAQIDEITASHVTTRLGLEKPVPIYVVYRTAQPQADGTVVYYKDPYRLDAGLAAQLK